MGLLDVLNGMQNGPRGNQSSGGMSPLTMALLGLLAYKAVKHISAGQSGGATPAPAPSGGTVASGGGLGGLLGGAGGSLGGMLGGLLAGGAAGGALSGGLGDLMKQFQQSGQGEVANSWVSQGDNKPISPGDLSKALGEDQISSLMQHSGMSRDELLSGLSQVLPAAVNHLTPDGRLPNEQEAARLI
jgi:uncharacterized protein YidB (DUF937 family)